MAKPVLLKGNSGIDVFFTMSWQKLAGLQQQRTFPKPMVGFCEAIFFSFFLGTIVSIGDPKKKYTRYEKIGQG